MCLQAAVKRSLDETTQLLSDTQAQFQTETQRMRQDKQAARPNQTTSWSLRRPLLAPSANAS